MTIPFVHNRATGLYVSETRLVWITAVRLGRRLRRTARFEEPVAERSVQAALRSLVARVRPVQPFVVTHLDPSHVRHALLQAPAFQDREALTDWLHAEAVRHLPSGVRLEDFVLRWRLLEQADDRSKCLLALASRKAVEERETLLRGAGLEALCIGSIDLSCRAAMSLNPAYAQGDPALLLLHPDRATLLDFEAGALQRLEAVFYEATGAEDETRLQELAAHLNQRPGRLIMTGGDAGEEIEAARLGCLFEGRLRPEILQSAAESKAHPVPGFPIPEGAPVLECLFRTMDTVDFLEPGQASARTRRVEKRQARVAVLGLSGLLLALLLVLVAATTYLEGQRREAEAVLSGLSRQAVRLDSARTLVRQLGRDLGLAERLAAERTVVARFLEQIGRLVEGGLWLDAVRLEEGSSASLRLTLSGASQSKEDLGRYLDRLERGALTHRTSLIFSEAVPASSLYGKEVLRDCTLTRFQIELAPVEQPDGKEAGG